MRATSRSAIAVACFAFLFGLVLIPEAMAAKPDVIKIACIPDMTGPYAAIVGPANVAFMDGCEYVNETGGIKGVKVEPLVRDCGGKVDVGMSHYMEIKEMKPRPPVIFGVISGLGEALKMRLNEDQFPAIWVCSTEVVYPAGYTFGWYPTYADLCGLFIDWLAETWKGQGRPKLAFLTWDTTYGRAVLYDEVNEYAKKKGVDVVATELFGVRDVDVSTQLVRIRDKGADWIFTNTAGRGPVIVAKGIKELGYKVGLAGSIGLDESCLYIDPVAMEGAITINHRVSWAEKDHPGIKVMNQYIEKNKRKETDKTIMYPMGFAGALLAKEVIGRAVDKVGWDKLSGAAIKAELENLKDFSPLDIAYFSYGPTRRSPSKAKVFQAKGKDLLPITGWRECPDLRPAKYK